MPQSEIQLDEDIAHQQLLWRLERITWVLMALAILAGAVGLVGHGPFSAREAAGLDSGLVVSYNRFERYHAQSQLTLELVDVMDAETRIRIGEDFLRRVEVMGIEPEPERVELDQGFMTYVFNTNAAGPILVDFKPVKAGPVQLEIGRDSAPVQTLPLFIYP